MFTENIIIREMEKDDYHKNYISLLTHLTTIDPHLISKEDFDMFIRNNICDQHKIFVAEDTTQDNIVASITVMIESKFIHNMSYVGHIEDVVVNPRYRGINLGKRLITEAVNYCKEADCYKVILDCTDSNMEFYNKCGFIHNGNQMSLSLSEC